MVSYRLDTLHGSFIPESVYRTWNEAVRLQQLISRGEICDLHIY